MKKILLLLLLLLTFSLSTDYPQDSDFDEGDVPSEATWKSWLGNGAGHRLPVSEDSRNYEDGSSDLGSSIYRWRYVYAKRIIADESSIFGAIFSKGNGVSGDASASDFTDMGGEYWFDTFTIDQDITVSSSIGFLVIRANTIIVSVTSTIDAKGKSKSDISNGGIGAGLGGTATQPNPSGVGFGFAAMAGSSGAGGNSGGTPANGGDVPYWGWNLQGTYTDELLGGIQPANGGNNGLSLPTYFFHAFLLNPIGWSQSSPGSGGSSDDGSAQVNGVDGVKGSANVALFCKYLTMTNSLVIDCDGNDGNTGNGSGSSESGSGSSGGSGAACSAVVYNSKTGSGTITQNNSGGTGGPEVVAGGGVENGGPGGDGGNAFGIEVDIANNTITIN